MTEREAIIALATDAKREREDNRKIILALAGAIKAKDDGEARAYIAKLAQTVKDINAESEAKLSEVQRIGKDAVSNTAAAKNGSLLAGARLKALADKIAEIEDKDIQFAVRDGILCYKTKNGWEKVLSLDDLRGKDGKPGMHGASGNSAYWFTGTAITGTGTGIYAVIAKSKRGDMYLNSVTYMVYQAQASNLWDYVCTLSGGGVQSDWAQDDAGAIDYIKNKPTIPGEQVQSDWAEDDTADKSYIKNKPDIPTVPENVSAFTNDAGYLTAETDPTVPTWAKAANKPAYTAAEVSAIPVSDKGNASGVAELDENGKVLSAQLPSYVDDVVEGTLDTFPDPGESGKIYIDTTTNLSYRWTGTDYTVISPSLALGETASTAYRGDRGKIAYEHSQSPHAPSSESGLMDLLRASIINAIYPVGSIYINRTDNTSPADLFGVGTWTRIKDRFLLAAGDIYGADTTGGAANHTHKGGAHDHDLSSNGWARVQPGGTTTRVYFDLKDVDQYNSSHYSASTGTTTESATAIKRGSILDGATDSGGAVSTDSASSLPPYMTAYMWQRTA